MTKFKIKVSKEGVDKGLKSGDFEDPPPGLYVVRVSHAEERQKEGGEYPYLNIGAFPVGKGRQNEKLTPPEGVVWGTVWDKVSASPAAEWRMTNFALAMGLKVNAKGEIIGSLELEEGKPGSIIGKLALLRVKPGENLEGNYRAEVGGWHLYNESGASEAEGDEDFDDEAAEEEPEDEEPFDEDEPDEEYYTEESLTALDNDGLKVAAGEFDLDTADYRVVNSRTKKVDLKKTRAALIAAILEAQGADEPEEEEEDPF